VKPISIEWSYESAGIDCDAKSETAVAGKLLMSATVGQIRYNNKGERG